MKRIHIVGIGGISLSAFAKILQDKGYIVSGSDICKTKITENLKKSGIKVFYSHNKRHIKNVDLLVFTGAANSDNPEIIEAKKQGIEIISRAELLGIVASWHKKVISVAGTHGKTTTTGMLATIFLMASKNPTIHIGGELPIIDGNVHIGEKEYFITEACEYKDSFLSLNSDYSIILNIQKDHMDYFKNMGNLQKSFKKFAKNTKQSGFVVANFDDKNCKKMLIGKNVISFGIDDKSVCQAKNITQKNQKYSYDLYFEEKKLFRVNLPVFGKHNIYNSLAAITVAIKENIDYETIKSAIESYLPSKRRYQQIVHASGATIVHDYAHHPTEILATMNIAKNNTKKQLVVVFEPHTYSRTQYLWNEFCKSFDLTDKLFIPPIYPAREEPIEGITNITFANALCKHNVDAVATKSLKATFELLKPYLKPGNTILLVGAGTIVHLAEMFGIE